MMPFDHSIRLIIADDHSVIVTGMSMLIRNHFQIKHIIECNHLESLIDSVVQNQPTHIILDVTFPEDSSLNYIEVLLNHNPELKILLFTMHPKNLFLNLLLQNPKISFCQKSESEFDLMNCISNFLYQEKSKSSSIKTDRRKLTFSKKEEAIVKLLLDGKSTTEIAELLNVKSNTISTYKRRIFDKTEASSVIELSKIFR